MDLASLMIKIIIPILLLVIGLVGNLFGLLALFRKNLKRFPARYIYICLACEDIMYLIFAITYRLFKNNTSYWKYLSNTACKAIKYIEFSFGAIQPCLLVLISLFKYCIIRYPSETLVKKKLFQLSCICAIYVCCLSFYFPYLLYSNLILVETEMKSNYTTTNSTPYECDISESHRNLLFYMDLLYSTLVPFGLMSLFSSLLIHTVLKSRMRQYQANTSQFSKKKFQKDLRLAFTAIALNLTFICLNLPVCFADFQADDFLLKEISNLLFYCSFCVDFYILAYFNSVIHKEVHSLLIELINKLK